MPVAHLGHDLVSMVQSLQSAVIPVSTNTTKAACLICVV